MNTTHKFLIGLMLFVGTMTHAQDQTPEIFDVSDVVAGAQRIETRWFLATGKWSDAGKDAGINSTNVQCYQRFGFCEVASAYSFAGQAWVDLSSYDILRWDSRELIAVDSSPICIVNTLRADFAKKKVTMSSTLTGEKGMPMPNGKGYCDTYRADDLKTAFLGGVKDELKKIDAGTKREQQ